MLTMQLVICFWSISGSAAASVSSGNFWQDTVIRFIVIGLNHLMDHLAFEKKKLTFNDIKKNQNRNYIGNPAYITAEELYNQIVGELDKWYYNTLCNSDPNDDDAFLNTCATR